MGQPSESSPARSALPPLTRAEWGLVLVLVAVQFTHMVDFVIIMPLGERIMTEFQIGPDKFSWVVAAYAWAAGLASLLAGPVMDRFDRKTVLLAMYGGFTVSTLACGLAPTYELLVAARAAAGVFGGLSAVALMIMIGDVFPSEKRGRAVGAVTSAFAVASIVGLPAGLLFSGMFGRAAPFTALAVLSAGVWALGWVRLPAVRGHLAAARKDPVAEFVAVVREPAHLWAFGFSFFTVLGTFTVASFMGPFLMSQNGWQEWPDLAVMYAAAGACTLVGMNAVGRLADRTPRRQLFRVMAAGALVVAVGVTNLPPVPLAVAVAGVSAFMVMAAGRMVPAQALLLGVPVPQLRGAFLSLNTAVQHLATGIAPLIAGLLLHRVPETGRLEGFPLVGVVSAVTAAVSLVLVGRVRPAVPPAVLAEARLDAPDAEPEPKPAAV